MSTSSIKDTDIKFPAILTISVLVPKRTLILNSPVYLQYVHSFHQRHWYEIPCHTYNMSTSSIKDTDIKFPAILTISVLVPKRTLILNSPVYLQYVHSFHQRHWYESPCYTYNISTSSIRHWYEIPCYTCNIGNSSVKDTAMKFPAIPTISLLVPTRIRLWNFLPYIQLYLFRKGHWYTIPQYMH